MRITPININGVIKMFITINKRTLIYIFSALLAIGMCILFFSIREAQNDMKRNIPAMSPHDLTILIDAGHGGADGGASANGLTEKDINLNVALKLKEVIEQSGGTVAMTRDGDYSTADENRTDGTSAKKSDLKRRREMVAESGADMFVSIHMNKFPQEKYWGAQVFYADTPDNSRKLGEAIQAALPRVLNDGNERAAKKTNGSIYILKNAAVPSVIVECGFLSNPDEAQKLKTEEYQFKLAGAVFEGICDYLKNADKAQDA